MIAILDYDAGNQTSVFRALQSQNIPAQITRSREVLEKADGIIFPGVGAAAQAMGVLQKHGLDVLLKDLIKQGKPLLGVCLGCQILLEHSEESDTKTLGIVKGECVAFSPDLHDEEGYPINIPHMGWNSVCVQKPCVLFEGISTNAEFYFVHGYYTKPSQELIIGTSYHGLEFCSVFGREGLWAVQFHPEKSGQAGLALLRNFYNYCKKV